MTNKKLKKIALAATIQTSYDFGFLKPMKASRRYTITRWQKRLDETLVQGKVQNKPLKNIHIGGVSEVTKIEEASSSLLHKLYHYAVDVKGGKASFGEIVENLNTKSQSKDTPIILSSYQLY